nr:MAG TPA: Gag-Pol polyprotein, CAPSID PROTEIN, MYRISTATE, MATRIX [Caudoviricetes sp.]
MIHDKVRVRKYGEANNMVWCSRIWNIRKYQLRSLLIL